jgi:hypothetical protein
MSPEEARSEVVLRRLRTEIEADHETLGTLSADLEETLRRRGEEPIERVWLVYIATHVHAYYTALETLLGRVARDLDREVPTGERWHQELLWQLAIELPGRRPAVLERELLRDLEALLRFRHFFRHAYGLELDPARVREAADRLLRVHQPIHGSLLAFQRFLEQAEAELRGD